LAVVLGRRARNVSVVDALNYVAGYTVANDLSARELITRPNVPIESPFRYDWIGQKCFDGSCPLGPFLVPAREVPGPQNLGIRLRVNGTLMQDSNTSQMIFSVAEQIARLSSRLTLYGDIILTGTPAGTGAEAGRSLAEGDLVDRGGRRSRRAQHSDRPPARLTQREFPRLGMSGSARLNAT
jgi:2-keto-4-pentenoate hydratase/2-oxohepta-3-ene-1,7-dioic acid hydratase in catechol pathway